MQPEKTKKKQMKITLNFQPEPHKKKLHKCVTPNEMHIKINYTPCSLLIFSLSLLSASCAVFFATNENPSEFSGNSIWLCVYVCVCVCEC